MHGAETGEQGHSPWERDPPGREDEGRAILGGDWLVLVTCWSELGEREERGLASF